MRLPNLFLAMMFLSGIAPAQDRPFEVTIKVVERPTDLPGAVTRTIQLPPPATDRAEEQSQEGLKKANEARTRGREFGKGIAEEAKNQGNKGGNNKGADKGKNKTKP